MVDTESPIFEAWADAYRRHGQTLDLDVWQHSLGTHGGFDPLVHLASLAGPSFDRAAVEQEVRESTARGCEGLPLLPGVVSVLQGARDLGLSRAVASSSSCRWVEGWLGRHGIRELVDVVVARDDVRQVKPDPELFLLAAERMGVPPPACVVFEDSPNGMRAALGAGMRCVAVPNALTRTLSRPEVDLVLSSLDELPIAAVLARLESEHAAG